MARLNKLLTGHQITDEVINRADSTSLPLGHDTILNDGTLEIWTGASGTGSQLTLTTDYTLGSEDTRLSTEAGETVYTKLAIVNGAYQSTNLYVTYKTVGDYASVENIGVIPEKLCIERSHYLLEPFPLPDLRAPAAWNPAAPDDYFPAICLTDIDTYVDIDAANAPAAVTKLRSIKAIFKDGMAGAISDPVVTNWAVAANVATLTFQNDTDHIAFLSAILEDENVHGSYTNWREVNLPAAIGNIPAGDYAITNVNASSLTISFAVVASNGSGAVTSSAIFYAFRVPGSTTTARVFSARGLTIHGANDANGYFVGGGLRRRGFFQGHKHIQALNIGLSAPGEFAANRADNQVSSTYDTVYNYTSPPIPDGADGSPRFSKETHGPAMAQHLYMHLKEWIA